MSTLCFYFFFSFIQTPCSSIFLRCHRSVCQGRLRVERSPKQSPGSNLSVRSKRNMHLRTSASAVFLCCLFSLFAGASAEVGCLPLPPSHSLLLISSIFLSCQSSQWTNHPSSQPVPRDLDLLPRQASSSTSSASSAASSAVAVGGGEGGDEGGASGGGSNAVTSTMTSSSSKAGGAPRATGEANARFWAMGAAGLVVGML